MASALVSQALRLAAEDRQAEGAALLGQAAGEGDAEASYALGLWRLEGRHLPRDLVEARRHVAQAEARGLVAAARTLSALMVLGLGGIPEWSEALALLQRWRERDPAAGRQLDLIGKMRVDSQGAPLEPALAEPVSEAPLIRRFPAFFTPDEAQFLCDLAEPRFKPALAFDERAGRFVSHPFRDATVAAFPAVFEWPAVHALNRRIAAASGTDVAQGESLQVLRYGPGQQYRPHLDAVPGLDNQRAWTMLVTLNEGYEGGETVFPDSEIRLRGRRGDAFLFRNIDSDGRPDRTSLHAGAPVTEGVKLIASRWIRQTPPPAGEAFGQHEVLSRPDDLGQ
ncbi:2OG-Fe(II) oxygenase [Sphingomonas tabacisoli]|uniref:2OG-Fe(II) oxygenase n=1 Tax=Sphingomonas tabacisoli TaxID=2249466 RepID=A0ABW4I4G8_9SPHN